MKGVIFLLVLCASQTVLADFRSCLNRKHVSSVKKLNDIVKKLHEDIQAAFEDGWRNGLNVVLNECWDDYQRLKNLNKHRVNMCENCYKIAIGMPIYQFAARFAEECYAENIEIIEKEEKKRRANTKECILLHYNGYVPLKEGEKHPAILL